MLYINGRFLNKKMSGIPVFGREIIKALDKLDNQSKITIIVPKSFKTNFKTQYLPIISFGKLKRTILWEQISLPLFMRKHKHDKLLNLCSSSPIFFHSYVVIHDIGLIYHKNFKPFLFTTWYKLMFKKTIKKAKKIYTVSNFCKNDIARFYHINKDNIIITYNGCEQIESESFDDSILKKYNITGKKYYLSVASNLPHKNLNLIVEYAKNHPNDYFVFVTSNIENVPSNVLIINGASFAQLKSLYKNAYCFILASSFEGFGIPPLEAIVSGCKKILLSDIEVFREIYGDTANYFDLNKGFYIPKALRDVKEEDIKKLKEKYSWGKIAKEFEKLL